MSASDAAPLPRLGEVFFDVRGSSRTMRLSWYADTGVAVFSIWQGGMCTGTFRLPIGDLPRMIDILERGPHGDGRAGLAADQDWASQEAAYPGPRDFAAGSTEARRAGYAGDDRRDARRSGYGRDELTDAQRPGYWQDDSAQAGAPHGRDAFSDGPYPGYQQQAHATGVASQSGWADGAQPGYGQERFVPPYVRGAPDDYPNDIPARGADVPGTGRRLAYQDDLGTRRSSSADYGDPDWSATRYSDDRRYRLPAERAGAAPDWTGQPSAARPDADPLTSSDPDGYTTGETRDYQPRRDR